MIPLALTATERAAFHAQLQATSRVRVRLTMLDLDGDEVSDLSDRLLDGQVNIDTTAETVRQLSATLDDPDHALALDSDAPSAGALFTDRMLRATYGFYVDSLARWVDVPIFTGPLATFERDGSQVAVSCLGKEHLARGQAWRTMHLRKGLNVGTAIKTILRERAGETRFAFPNVTQRLPRGGVSLGRMSDPWLVAQGLARGIGRQLYYDGDGVCRMRRAPTASVWTFNGDQIVSDPKVTYDLASVRNTVWVRGHKPDGKPRIEARVAAGRSHPLSPWRQGRTITNARGNPQVVPRYLVHVEERNGVRSVKDARALANRLLRGLLLEGVSATFDALPIVHLDPLDVVRLSTDEASLTFVLQQASIPLTHNGAMSVGTVKRVGFKATKRKAGRRG